MSGDFWPLRIAGLSGIWKGYNYKKHDEAGKIADDIKSIYHVRRTGYQENYCKYDSG